MVINKGFYPVAVFIAALNVIQALTYSKVHNKNYFVNVAYFLDLLGNALAGGNPHVTVSARVGLNAHLYRVGELNGWSAKLWAVCEQIIDYTFEPIDGKTHCWNVYIRTKEARPFVNIHQGYNWMLALFVIPCCLVCMVLIPIIHLIARFYK